MDARIDVYRVFGLAPGEAHVIRNAGAVVTDDVLRSLVVSQRKLGTRRIALVAHTRCGMTTFTDDAFAAELATEVGAPPPYAFDAAPDVATLLARGIARIRADRWLVSREVTGYVYDVETGTVTPSEESVPTSS